MSAPTHSEERADGSCAPTCSALPDHQLRYARAWTLYRDDTLDDESRQILEREMDSAQNHFGWDEFQEFKQTLHGFVQFWGEWKRELLKQNSQDMTSDSSN